MARKRRTSVTPFPCGPGALAVALPGPPVEIWWTSWDRNGDCFLPWRILPLPALSGEVKLLAASFVATYEHGLFQPYIVLQRGLSIVVWSLDLDREHYDVIAEISLHGFFPKKKKYLSHPLRIIEDCWLLDGPTVVATCHGRILISCPQSLPREGAWRAQVLMSQHSDEWKTAKPMYCGNVGTEAIFLSVPPPSEHSAMPEKQSGGSCFSLRLDSLSDSAVHQPCRTDTTPVSGWMPGLANPVMKDCPLLRLGDLKPSLVTCLATVPHPAADSFVEDSFDIAYGTVDKRLLRYRDGKLLASLQLEEVPSSLYFAVVGGGQGILLVVQKGGAQDVTAVCAETHQKIKSWTDVSGVLLSDVCMLGHDQIILFPKSQYWNSANSGEDQENIVISDLISAVQLGSHNMLSQSEERSTQDIPTFMTDSILSSLNSRVEAGIVELNDAEFERSGKLELLRSSCCLVQGMEARCSQLVCSTGEGRTAVALQLVGTIAVTQKVSDSTWFLVTDIKGQLPEGTELHDLSLVVTTQHGHIVGESSVLRSLMRGASGQLVANATLIDFCSLSSSVLNISLTAMVSTGKASSSYEAGNFKVMGSGHDDFVKSLHLPKVSVHLEKCGAQTTQNTCYKVYTQWLCKVDVAIDALSECFDPMWSSGFQEVAKHQQLVISSTGEEHLSLLPDIVKSSLGMVDNSHTETHDSRVREFVMPPGLPWADIKTACFSTIAVLGLRSGDSRQLVIMERSLKRSLKHNILMHHGLLDVDKKCIFGFQSRRTSSVSLAVLQLKILPRTCAPDMSVHASEFASRFLRELEDYVDRQQVKIGSKRKPGNSQRQPTCSSLQIVTDRLYSHLLLFTTTSTELEL